MSGLAIWKPVQFPELAALFYDFQGARLAHFIGMALIVGFLVVHVALALLVPKTLGAMITGGPVVDDERAGTPHALPEDDMAIRTPSPSIFRPQGRHRPERAGRERKLIEEIDRRKILRGAVSLGALTMLTGCNVTDRARCRACCERMSQLNDSVQELLFRPNNLAPTYSRSAGA